MDEKSVTLQSLSAMFDSIEPDVVSLVLENCGGNVDAAINSLLTLSPKSQQSDSSQPVNKSSEPLSPPQALKRLELRDDFLRPPSYFNSTKSEMEKQDEALARMLQEQMYIRDLGRRPEVLNYNGRLDLIDMQSPNTSASSRNRSSSASSSSDISQKLSELGSAAKRNFGILLKKFSSNREKQNNAQTSNYLQLRSMDEDPIISDPTFEICDSNDEHYDDDLDGDSLDLSSRRNSSDMYGIV